MFTILIILIVQDIIFAFIKQLFNIKATEDECQSIFSVSTFYKSSTFELLSKGNLIMLPFYTVHRYPHHTT